MKPGSGVGSKSASNLVLEALRGRLRLPLPAVQSSCRPTPVLTRVPTPNARITIYRCCIKFRNSRYIKVTTILS
jgi:hypothetical protein